MSDDFKCNAENMNAKCFEVLVSMQTTVTKAAGRIEALHHELLGDRGHIARIDRHITNLYQRDEDLRRHVDDRTTELERALGKTDGSERSLRDKLSGGWGLVVVLLALLEGAAALFVVIKGVH